MIFADYNSGKTYAELAARYPLARKQIRGIVKRMLEKQREEGLKGGNE
jgi:Mor family transcriptional regulator